MIVGMLRVKNEARWIGEVLDALRPACDRIFVMDDHSEDRTAAIAKRKRATVWASPFEGMDEARDKSWFAESIAREVPIGAWVLCVDGDEVLEPSGAEKLRATVATGRAPAYALPILYLWDRRDQVRIDGVYGRFSRPSLFQLDGGSVDFKRTGAQKNLHCSSVPARYIGRCGGSDAALLHLGYMDREDRLRKFDYYRQIDPGNRAEDGYRHMVIGDLPEYPSTMRAMHGGPLQLRAL